MTLLSDPRVSDMGAVQRNMDALARTLFESDGDPNGKIVASPGALCVNRNGGVGQTLWVKETGVGTATGWAAK